MTYKKLWFRSKIEFPHQIPLRSYFRLWPPISRDQGDIKPNELWCAYVHMDLYHTPVSNRESIFFTCPVSGRSSQKPCQRCSSTGVKIFLLFTSKRLCSRVDKVGCIRFPQKNFLISGKNKIDFWEDFEFRAKIKKSFKTLSGKNFSKIKSWLA